MRNRQLRKTLLAQSVVTRSVDDDVSPSCSHEGQKAQVEQVPAEQVPAGEAQAEQVAEASAANPTEGSHHPVTRDALETYFRRGQLAASWEDGAENTRRYRIGRTLIALCGEQRLAAPRTSRWTAEPGGSGPSGSDNHIEMLDRHIRANQRGREMWAHLSSQLPASLLGPLINLVGESFAGEDSQQSPKTSNSTASATNSRQQLDRLRVALDSVGLRLMAQRSTHKPHSGKGPSPQQLGRMQVTHL